MTVDQMFPDAARLLERYVAAKDGNRPQLMDEIYAPDAVLTYSIATDSISFPARTVGLEAITRTLVVEFGQRFTRCRTYYIVDDPPGSDASIPFIPWLVLMREEARSCTRVGRGFYAWTFERAGTGPLHVKAMHIHIDRMDLVDDADGQLLATLQSPLPYPWLQPATLHDAFHRLAGMGPAAASLEDFERADDATADIARVAPIASERRPLTHRFCATNVASQRGRFLSSKSLGPAAGGGTDRAIRLCRPSARSACAASLLGGLRRCARCRFPSKLLSPARLAAAGIDVNAAGPAHAEVAI